VDVLKLVGGGEGGLEWGDGKEKGVVIGISCCGIGIGASWAMLFLWQWSCQLLSIGLHCNVVFKVGGHLVECVGREVVWFGEKESSVIAVSVIKE